MTCSATLKRLKREVWPVSSRVRVGLRICIIKSGDFRMFCDLHGWRLCVRIEHPSMKPKAPSFEYEVSTELSTTDYAHRGTR